MKLYLTGFMGSGKSLIGKLLAQRLDFQFLDLDDEIERRAGMTISEIFSQKGEQAFRDMESEALQSTRELDNVIIATGGGAPCFNGNITWMNDHGLTLFLDVSPQVLANRLSSEKEHRPLLKDKTAKGLVDFIESKMAERRKYYEQAHFVCHADDDVNELVSSIVLYFSRFLKNH